MVVFGEPFLQPWYLGVWVEELVDLDFFRYLMAFMSTLISLSPSMSFAVGSSSTFKSYCIFVIVSGCLRSIFRFGVYHVILIKRKEYLQQNS